MEAGGGKLVWVRGRRKDSALFIGLLRRLDEVYEEASRIHLVVDNYCIHKSKASRAELEALGGRIQLHFLPPYCPQENKMELQWLHLHRNVTCNHQCRELEELMDRAESYLRTRAKRSPATRRAAA